jgi:hypothetical protein
LLAVETRHCEGLPQKGTLPYRLRAGGHVRPRARAGNRARRRPGPGSLSWIPLQRLFSALVCDPDLFLRARGDGRRARPSMPLSVQFVGRYFGEARLFQVAREWERAARSDEKHPPVT